MNIRILPGAQEDLIDAYWFYERQNEGVGDYFIGSIIKDIETLNISADGHVIHLGKHRKIASVFPYSIYYLIDNGEVNIYAVVDDRHDPEWISERLY
jgi:plasmid stabilization system protein ParE